MLTGIFCLDLARVSGAIKCARFMRFRIIVMVRDTHKWLRCKAMVVAVNEVSGYGCRSELGLRLWLSQ